MFDFANLNRKCDKILVIKIKGIKSKVRIEDLMMKIEKIERR
jgi:hypothetical protein